jgi:hypothetical protein
MRRPALDKSTLSPASVILFDEDMDKSLLAIMVVPPGELVAISQLTAPASCLNEQPPAPVDMAVMF